MYGYKSIVGLPMESQVSEYTEGNLDVLGSSAMQLVGVGVVIAVGALILTKIGENSSFSSDATANQTLANTKSGLSSFSDFIPVIAIIIVAVVIIAYLNVFRG